MNRCHFSIAAFAFASIGLFPGVALTQPKSPGEDKITVEVTGSIQNEGLMGEAPEVIVSQKALDRLVKAWNLENLPVFDFKNNLAVVAVSRSSQLLLSTRLDDKGNLRLVRNESKDIANGFRYAIRSVKRAGVITVNGRPLPTE